MSEPYVYLTTAAAGNPLYFVGAPDGIGVYISANTWRLKRRLTKAKARVMRSYEKRRAALT